MAVSYKKLWKLLIDKDMKKKELEQQANVSHYTVSKMYRGENVTIDRFPEWLAKDYAIETLDDVTDCLDDPDFDSILEDFLERMPCSRESVDEMLETVSALDLWPVYRKLLTDCVALLTPEELAKLKADYKEKFSISLSGEEE